MQEVTNYTESRIREFILDDHPCVMAQSVIADDSIEIQEFDGMSDADSVQRLFGLLKDYVIRQDLNSKDFESFIAVFRNDKFLDEKNFELALWKLLENLHQLDDQPWDPETSSDPSDKNFSFSLHGTSFYIVGMHPHSSRFARKSPYTMIVFNLHAQFELLRTINRYDRVRSLIRRRDKNFQGYVNPMLSDFGTKSEARQYSGRNVDDSWKCPFNTKEL